jgi:hypothetical protein
MTVVVYSRPCGWHVILSSTGPTMESRLKPHVIGKACVPYIRPGDQLTSQDQLNALVVGLHQVATMEPQICNSL